MSKLYLRVENLSPRDDLLKYSKIVSLYNGYVVPKEDNLRRIMDAVDPSKFPGNLPVAILAVIGPKGSGKSLLTNFLIQYLRADDGGWMAKLVKRSEKGEPMTPGFSWDSVSNPAFFKPKEQSDAASGIYLWPEPFLTYYMVGGDRKPIVIWVMHIHCEDDTEGENELEKFLVTTCSRITEIKWNNDEFRLLEHHQSFTSKPDDQTSDPPTFKHLCDSAVYVIRSETKTTAQSDDEAKQELLKMMTSSEKTATYQTLLDRFQHVNVKWMKESSEALHDNNGRLNTKVIKFMSRLIKEVVETMVDEFEIFPKMVENHQLTLENMQQHLVISAQNLAWNKHIKSGRVDEAKPEKAVLCYSSIDRPPQPRIRTMFQQRNVATAKDAGKPQLNNEENTFLPRSHTHTEVTPKFVSSNDATVATSASAKFLAKPFKQSISDENSCINKTEFGLEERTKDRLLANKCVRKNGQEEFQQLQNAQRRSANDEQFQQELVGVKGKRAEEEWCFQEGADLTRNIHGKQRDEMRQQREVTAEWKPKKETKRPNKEAEDCLLEEETRRQTEARERSAMEEIIPTAVAQTKTDFSNIIPFWISNHLTLETVKDIPTLDSHVLKCSTEEYRKLICPSLWPEFQRRVGSFIEMEFKLSSKLDMIHKAVSTFTWGVKTHFELNSEGFFSQDDNFDQMVLKEFEKIEQEGMDEFSNEIVMKACIKLTQIYREHNQLIMKCEDDVITMAMTTVGYIYQEQMKRYLRRAPYSSLKLEDIHSKLVEKLVGAFKNACSLSPNTDDDTLATQIESLKMNFEKAFVFHKQTNECRFENVQAETNKIIRNLKYLYNEKVEEMLKKHKDGLDAPVLGKLHEEISVEIMNLLEMEIQLKMGHSETIEEYKATLQGHVDNYWHHVVLVENLKNINVKKERDEQLEQEQREVEARRQKRGSKISEETTTTHMALMALDNSIGSCSSLQSTCNLDDSRRVVPPLVFHLQTSRIVMAVKGEEGQCVILNNEFEESQTPAVVVVTPDNDLLYGSKALDLMDSLRDDVRSFFWSVADFFLHYDSSWSKNVCINGNDFPITTEFMLGFLLKKLKQAAEDILGGPSDTAILAIPFWLTSTQRIRIKDGAEIAGFTYVYLVNEASAAASNFVLRDGRPEGRGKVLVVTESFDRVDAFVYTYHCTTAEKKVIMVAHGSNYDSEEVNKPKWGDESKGVSRVFRRVYNYFTNSSPEPVKVDKAKVLSGVRRACKHAVDHASTACGGEKLKLNETLVISENPIKWNNVLEAVVRNFGRKAGSINKDSAVMYGATGLSKNPEEIGYILFDMLASDVLRHAITGGREVVVSKEYTLPAKLKKETCTMSPGHRETKFYQNFLGNQHLIGELRVNGVRYDEQLEPNLDLTNEGVITLDFVRLLSMNSGTTCCVAEEQVQWITPNLTKLKIQELRGLMNTTVLQVAPPAENPGFTKAKMELLEKCQEMMDKLQNGRFKIKSVLVKRECFDDDIRSSSIW